MEFFFYCEVGNGIGDLHRYENSCMIFYISLFFTNSVYNRISGKECVECKRPHEHSKNKSRSHKKEAEKREENTIYFQHLLSLKQPSTLRGRYCQFSALHCEFAPLLSIIEGDEHHTRSCEANNVSPGLNPSCKRRLLIA